MKVVAISVKGQEFFYSASSAHKVSERSADTICRILNKVGYMLNSEDKVWHIHTVDQYDMAYQYAEYQHFTIRNGRVKEHKR